ncbi:hypothetical protein HKD37_20G056956 [Glycine soja]
MIGMIVLEQTLLDYLTQVGIANNILLPTLGAAVNFELRHGFLQMIESNQFHGTDSEDPVAHLKRFLQLTGTINVQNMPTEYITTWEDCVNKFLQKHFSVVKTDQIQRDIGNLVQDQDSLGEAWERFQELLRSCPRQGFSPQRIVQIFYGGVPSHNRTTLDAACGGNLMLKQPRSLKICPLTPTTIMGIGGL